MKGTVMKQFSAMVYARTMEFVRDRGTFFWNLLFPVVLVFGFAFAFSGNATLFKIGTYGIAPTGSDFTRIEQSQFIPYDAAKAGEEQGKILYRLRRHELDMVIDYGAGAYWINEKGRNASLLRRLVHADHAIDGFTERRVSGDPIRYVDWFVPGVIGMNMLFSCLSGVGFVIVRYRKNGVLKRLRATPVSALSFVSAQALSRFLIVMVTSAFVFLGTNFFLHFMMKGSWLDLLLVMSLGILSMISLGLAFASRFKSEELAGGIMNLITMPMLGLSGVFFPLEGAPKWIGLAADALPLTHVTKAARDIMLEGSSLVAVAPHLLFLLAFSALSLVVASMLFRWD
jgi:ABC-type multidrug transport system permease subunit